MTEKEEVKIMDKNNGDGTSLKTIVAETSAHGIRNVLSSNRSFVIRLVWLLGVVGAAVCLALTLYNVAIEYYKYPFMTATHTVPTRELTFPTVTVCNISPYDTSKYEHSEEMKTIMTWFTLPQMTSPLNFSEHPYNTILNTSMKRLVDELAQPMHEYFVMCVWQNEFVDCRDIFTPVYTFMGRCHVFNANESSRYSSSQMGSASGLRVIFHVNQDHGVVTSDYSAGLKMHLHEPHELPDLLSEGFVLATGHSTSVAITKNEFHFLPHPYKAFGDESCVDTSTPDFPVKVNYSNIYSPSACISECVGEKALNVCDCKYITQPEADQPYCSFYDGAFCFLPTWYKFYDEARNNNTCDCPRPCSFVRYQTRMSTSAFPSLATGNLLVNAGVSQSVEQTRTDYGEFRIYYEDLILYETRHEPQYTLSSIMATVGGQMGFFLGASLMTVAELCEFVILFLGRLSRWTLLRFSGAGQMRSQNKIVQVRPIS